MARQESPAQPKTVERVMHEFKHGDLPRGNGGKVRSRKQAIAIALSEAGASNRQSPAKNRARLRKTTRQERAAPRKGDTTTRKELYAEATRRSVRGRSAMTKAELARALHR